MLRSSRCTAVVAVSAVVSLCLDGALGFVLPLTSVARTGAPARTQSSLRMSAVETETEQYTLDKKPIGGPLTPISNSILVRVRSKDATSDGGIILTENSQEKPTEGEVLSMGPGKIHPETGVSIPLPCAVGDKVLYGKYDGTAVDYMGEDHQFVRDDNILFVYSGERMQPDTIKMIRDEVLVKIELELTESKSGLVFGIKEENTGAGPTTGEVVAIGPGRTSADGEVVPMTVAKGDFIKFRNFAGSELSMQGVGYRVMTIGEILAKW